MAMSDFRKNPRESGEWPGQEGNRGVNVIGALTLIVLVVFVLGLVSWGMEGTSWLPWSGDQPVSSSSAG